MMIEYTSYDPDKMPHSISHSFRCDKSDVPKGFLLTWFYSTVCQQELIYSLKEKFTYLRIDNERAIKDTISIPMHKDTRFIIPWPRNKECRKCFIRFPDSSYSNTQWYITHRLFYLDIPYEMVIDRAHSRDKFMIVNGGCHDMYLDIEYYFIVE